jgi:hypothetical protein
MHASQLALPPATQSDAFPDDPIHATVVLAPEIRFERLGVTHEEVAFVCVSLPKLVKSAVQVDVVDDQRAACAEGLPCVVELEEEVAPAVPAVVNEQIDRRKSLQQRAESQPTRTADVPPPRPQVLSHRNTDLIMELRRPWWWKIDAPKPPGLIPFESLEDEARRDPASDSCLDDVPRTMMPRHAPDGTHESRFAVAPPAESTASEFESRLELRDRLLPKLPEFARVGARPLGADVFVHRSLGVRIDPVRARRPRHEPADAVPRGSASLFALGNPFLEHDQGLDRVAGHGTNGRFRPVSRRHRTHEPQCSLGAGGLPALPSVGDGFLGPCGTDRAVLRPAARASAPATRGAANFVP